MRRQLNPDGNERLTAAVGVLLLLPILAELATIVLGVHTFMSLHVFIGLALIPPVLLKMASTGWRFARYYTRSRAYVAHGPPQLAMRLLAPLLVAATVILFSSGVAMGILHGHALQIARRLHGPSSVIWLVLIGVHVLVYLKRALTDSGKDLRSTTRGEIQGATRRSYTLATAVILGLVVGAATVPAQHRWVKLRHHHDRRDNAAPTTKSAGRIHLNASRSPGIQVLAQRSTWQTHASTAPTNARSSAARVLSHRGSSAPVSRSDA